MLVAVFLTTWVRRGYVSTSGMAAPTGDHTRTTISMSNSNRARSASTSVNTHKIQLSRPHTEGVFAYPQFSLRKPD